MACSFYIVTPSRNQLEMLKCCVASVADQRGVVVHHHVQDAASTDGTGLFLAEHANRTATARPAGGTYTFSFESAPDGGMYDAINRGWRRSAGAHDIYAYINCDEQYLEGTLDAVAAHFDAHPKTDVAFGNVLVIDPRGDLICRRDVVLPTRSLVLTDHLPVYTAATFVRKEALFAQSLFFDDGWRVIGDAEWVLRMLDRGLSLSLADRYLSTFVFNRANLSTTPEAKAETDRLHALAPRIVRLLSKPIKVRHWIRKAQRGAYVPRTVCYDIYLSGKEKRSHFSVRFATNFWRERRFRAPNSS